MLAQCDTCLPEPYTQGAEAGGASTGGQHRLQIKTLLQNTKNEHDLFIFGVVITGLIL